MRKLLPIVALTLLGGCVSQAAKPPHPYPRVLIDQQLKGKVAVQTLQEVYGRTGLLKVQVALQNDSSLMLPIRHRIEWLDTTGMQIKTLDSRWQVEELRPGEALRLSYGATRPEVSDFKVQVYSQNTQQQRTEYGNEN